MLKTIKWLWACYLARRYYTDRRTLFSDRTTFLDALRSVTNKNRNIAYPDAWFWITPAYVRGAVKAAARNRQGTYYLREEEPDATP